MKEISFPKSESISWEEYQEEQSGQFTSLKGYYRRTLMLKGKPNYEELGKFFEELLFELVEKGIVERIEIEKSESTRP